MIETQIAWPSGWQEHEQQQLERQARLSWEEKLQWLEDAHHFVLDLEARRKNSPPETSPPLADTENE